MGKLRDALTTYRDAAGLVQPAPGQGSGNGLLFTGEAILALRNGGELIPEQDGPAFLASVRACEVRDAQGQPIAGLWYRHPAYFRADVEGPDDHCGIAAASRILRLPLAQEWLNYGRNTVVRVPLSTLVGAVIATLIGDSNLKPLLGLAPSLSPDDATLGRGPLIPVRFVFNNQAPGTWSRSAFLGRFPALIASMEYANGEMPPMWRRLWWAFTIYTAWSASEADTDAHTLTWTSIAAMDGQDPIGKAAAQKWYQALVWKFPGLKMRAVFSRYFSPDDPLAIYTVTEDESGSYS